MSTLDLSRPRQWKAHTRRVVLGLTALALVLTPAPSVPTRTVVDSLPAAAAGTGPLSVPAAAAVMTASHPVPSAAFDPVAGALTVRGAGPHDTLRLAVVGEGLTLTIADPLSRPLAALPGVTPHELRTITVEGAASLEVASLPGASDLSITGERIMLAAPLSLERTLRVDAARLTI